MALIDKISNGIDNQELLLKNLAGSGKTSVIYGAGVYAYVLYQYLQAKDITIKCFVVDKAYKTADAYMGLDVVALEDMMDEIPGYHVFTGVTNYPAVKNSLRKKGIEDVIVVDVPDFLNIPARFMDYEFVMENLSQFEEAYELFEDELSRDTYLAAINTKLNNDLNFIRPYANADHL